MFRLIRFLKGYEKESIIGPLFKLLESCFELCVPLIMASVIDIGIKNNDTAYILKMGVLLVGMGVLGLVCSVTAQYFAAKAAFGFGTALRSSFFAHINRFTFSEIDKIGSSTLINRTISDINQVQSGINLILRLFLRSPFLILGALVLAFLKDFQMALIFSVATFLLAGVIFGLVAITLPIYKKAQKQLDRLALLTGESIAGVRVIRAFSREKKEQQRFAESNDLLTQTQLFAGKFSALLNPLTYVLVNLGIVCLLYQGSFAVDSGRITQGDVVALVNYMTQILLALMALSTLTVSAGKAFASANRINQIFDISPAFESGKECPAVCLDTAAVEFNNVSFGYGGTPALSNLNLCIKQGQTIGIIGGTGCGKSSLVQLIPRFYAPAQGSVLVFGTDTAQWDLQCLRRRIGFVSQKPALFEGSIRDNLCRKFPDASDDMLWNALRTAQAEEFVSQLEQKLDAPVLQGGKNFSGGQRQRLSIACALVGNPDILIFDDSTSALDYATDSRFRAAIAQNLQPHQTVFWVSQRVSCVKNADLIVVLDDGKIAGIGTHSELQKNCEVYCEICLSQQEVTVQ